MSGLLPEVSSSFHLGAKGRTVIPVNVRREAELHEGVEVRAVVLGRGRVLLETRDAVRERVWDGAKASDASAANDDARSARLEDIAVSDEAAARRSAAGGPESEARGAALLEQLGL